MSGISERQRRVLERLRDGWWLSANIDFVHLGNSDGTERVLYNTFESLHRRRLIQFSGKRFRGKSYYEITPTGLAALPGGERD